MDNDIKIIEIARLTAEGLLRIAEAKEVAVKHDIPFKISIKDDDVDIRIEE